MRGSLSVDVLTNGTGTLGISINNITVYLRNVTAEDGGFGIIFNQPVTPNAYVCAYDNAENTTDKICVIVDIQAPVVTQPGTNPYGGNNILPPMDVGMGFIGIFSNFDPLLGLMVSLLVMIAAFIVVAQTAGGIAGALASGFTMILCFAFGILEWWIVLAITMMLMSVVFGYMFISAQLRGG